MQTNEYLHFREECRMKIQQGLVPVTHVLEMLDKCFSLGEVEGLRQIETKLSPATMEKFQKALAETEPEPEDIPGIRMDKIREYGKDHKRCQGRTYYLKNKDLWCRDFSCMGGSADHDVVLENLNEHEMIVCISYDMERK